MSFTVIITGGIFEFDLLIIAGIGLFIASVVFIIFMFGKIREFNNRIETYCPKCDTPALVHVKTTKEKTGATRKDFITRGGSSNYYECELIRDTKHYKCTTCEYETQFTSEYPDETSRGY